VLTTFPNYPSGIVPPEWRGKFFWHGLDGEIRLFRIWSYATPNRGFFKRILGHLSFAFFSALAGFFMSAQDIIVVESPPLFDGFAALWLSWMMRAPYLFWVADLWPEAAVELGALKNAWLIRLAKSMALCFYRHAALVVAVTSGIREKIIADGVREAKVKLLANGVDHKFFCPSADSLVVRTQLGVSPGQFLVLYAGTLGVSQNLTTVLKTAEQFQRERRPARFVIAGDGAEKELLQATARELGLVNLAFLGSVPKAKMPALLNAADCVLVPLKNVDGFRCARPTKLLEAMACAKPVVLSASGEAEDIVRAAGAGYCVPPDSADAIHDAIWKLANDPVAAAEMGAGGRDYVIRNFSREVHAATMAEFIRLAVAQKRRKNSTSPTCSGVGLEFGRLAPPVREKADSE